MSQVINDATSAMNATHDETTSMLDTTVPLGEFLDEQIARVRQHDIVESDHMNLKLKILKHLLELVLLDMNCQRYRKVML